MRHFEYPSIEQFRNVVSQINRASNGYKDEAAIMPHIKPTIVFNGTVKLHGTNVGVVKYQGQIYAQSRTRTLTPQSDNYGFAAWMSAPKQTAAFNAMFDRIYSEYKITDDHAIVLYGEWAGQGIQSNVAIANLPKSLFIFDACIINAQDNIQWIDSDKLFDSECGIYNVANYATWQMEIDFNFPQAKQNALAEITNAVEAECPVGKAFGFSGVGEGVVWKTVYQGERYAFKVKGEKHSVSKVSTLANVDVEKIENIKQFCEYAVTENRINQAIENIFGTERLNANKTGDIIRWMCNDIMKEEQDTLLQNKLTDKDVNKYIATNTRLLFISKLNKQEGL